MGQSVSLFPFTYAITHIHKRRAAHLSVAVVDKIDVRDIVIVTRNVA